MTVDINSLAKSIGIFAMGAAIYLFVGPKLLTNPPFINEGAFNFPGLTPAAVSPDVVDAGAEVTSFATFADDVVPGIFPQGVRMAGGV